MKRLFYIASTILISASILTSCERDISTLNSDPKNPEVVPSKNLVVTSERYLADFWVTPSVNQNISRFFTQQWTETQYVDETNYNFITRNQPQNHFNTMYRDVLGPLKQASIFLDAEPEDAGLSIAVQAKVKQNKKAVIEILSIFAWINLVDSFGNVPYSEALQSETGSAILQPKYDDAATVYDALAVRLNNVVGDIDPTVGSYVDDAFYQGNMSQWIKVANSLKLRMGLNLSDKEPVKAKTLIESAVAAGVITNVADNFAFPYVDGLVSNPIFQNLVKSERDDFIPSDVFVNSIKSKSDPRRTSFFAENLNKALGTVATVTPAVLPSTGSVITFVAPITNSPIVGQYVFIKNTSPGIGVEDDKLVGKVISFTSNSVVVQLNAQTVVSGDVLNFENYVGGPYGQQASYPSFSHVTTTIKQPTFPGYLIESVEVKFMLAEAAAKGFNVGNTAQNLYNDAVTASMNQWNVSAIDTATYLSANPYNSANYKESIGMQAWYAMYNRGIEGWYFFRRLDYPKLTVPGTAEGLVYRLTYSNNETSTNTANVNAAATAIGGDKYTTRIFWDTAPN